MATMQSEHTELDYLRQAEILARHVPDIDPNAQAKPITQAAVIGAGNMGGGIALCFAQAGIPVVLIDVTDEAIASGMARLRSNLEASVKRGSISAEESQTRLALITGAVGLEAAGDADLVIEAAFEELQVKIDIFQALERITRPDTILATNTSYLDINAIASALSRPSHCIGLHFFSPANIMRLLEVVRASATAPDVLLTGLKLGERLNKISVVVGVCYGFVGNRMLAVRTAAAERLLLEGATPLQIDKALTDFGFKMGPFAVSDLSGLDIAWRARKSSGRTAPVFDALCEKGWFGQKTGRGFYRYSDGARRGEPDPEVEILLVGLAASAGLNRRIITDEEIIARIFYPMVNEGMRILDEGIASRASDIDLVWVNGFSWPASTGGPMRWAETVGLERITSYLDTLALASKDISLQPCERLRRMIR